SRRRRRAAGTADGVGVSGKTCLAGGGVERIGRRVMSIGLDGVGATITRPRGCPGGGWFDL
ncbi:hypothetical protein, partial [Burkholderia sp. LMG 13014]|uniref:hypothetical protein n=1 Tax=Burkholderia sp. LMG 13014 TaxID=2709306 RepID=UPI001965504A